MANVLVMISAGEVYDHDSVRWYQPANNEVNLPRYYNVGDCCIYDSSLKLLSYDVVEDMDIRTADDGLIERWNAEFDYCFLRGSNYVRPGMEWERTRAILSKLRIPVIAFGIGAQAARAGAPSLSEDTKWILHWIADPSASVGVRGAFSAEVLHALGIKNARIVGCPTMFRHNDPALRIELGSADSVRRVGFTLRREVSAPYARDIPRYLKTQRETLRALAARFELSVATQAELEEKAIALGTPEQRERAIADLVKTRWFAGPDDPLVELYRRRLFFSHYVADYDDFARRQDLVVGFRVHGNMMALANRVPSVYFTYDSRTAEFADTFAIPAHDVYGERPFALEEYWDQGRFDRFNQAYARRYRDMAEFLDENRVPHRMVPAPAPARVDAA